MGNILSLFKMYLSGSAYIKHIETRFEIFNCLFVEDIFGQKYLSKIYFKLLCQGTITLLFLISIYFMSLVRLIYWLFDDIYYIVKSHRILPYHSYLSLIDANECDTCRRRHELK